MAIKKIHTYAPKKSDSKKKMEASNSKTKSTASKQSTKKKFNGIGDEDSL